MADETKSPFGQAQALRRRAEQLDELGRREEACEAYRQAGSLYEKAGEFGLAGSVLGMLSHRLRELGRPEEACDVLERAAVIHRCNPDKWEAAKGLRQVAGNFMTFGAWDRYKAFDKEARRLQDRARSARTESGDPGERIGALHEYAVSRGHGWHGSRQARKALKEALHINAGTGAGQRANIVSALASVEYRAGDHEQARVHYREAIDLSTQDDDWCRLERDLLALGEMERHTGCYDAAEAPLLRALDIARTQGSRETFLLGQLAQLEQCRKNWEDARAWCRKGLRAARNDKDKDSECLALRGWAATEAKAGDLERARELLREACRTEETANYWRGHAYILRDFGDMERDAGNIEEAREQYETTLGIFRDHGDWQGQAQLNWRLGGLERDINPLVARQYFRKAARCYAALGHARMQWRATMMAWSAAISAWLHRGT